MQTEYELIDHYNDDETELKFLKSKPTCFIVLGKPVRKLNNKNLYLLKM